METFQINVQSPTSALKMETCLSKRWNLLTILHGPKTQKIVMLTAAKTSNFTFPSSFFMLMAWSYRSVLRSEDHPLSVVFNCYLTYPQLTSVSGSGVSYPQTEKEPYRGDEESSLRWLHDYRSCRSHGSTVAYKAQHSRCVLSWDVDFVLLSAKKI
jgi:hypothetical protein